MSFLLQALSFVKFGLSKDKTCKRKDRACKRKDTTCNLNRQRLYYKLLQVLSFLLQALSFVDSGLTRLAREKACYRKDTACKRKDRTCKNRFICGPVFSYNLCLFSCKLSILRGQYPQKKELVIEKRIYTSKQKEEILYSVILNETMLISSSQLLIENTIRNKSQQIAPESLNELFKVTEDNSVYFKLDTGSFLLKNNFYPSFTNSFGKWGALRIDLANKKMAFHGFNSRNDSLPYFLNLFKASKPIVLKSPNYIPEVASSIKMYAIEDLEQFNSTQNKIKNRELVLDTIFNKVEEIATFKLKENALALIHFTTFEPDYLSKIAENNTPETEYRDYPIYRLNNASLVENSFSSLWD